jgi:hypothetical protein
VDPDEPFADAVQRLASANGWVVGDAGGNRAVLGFDVGGGATHQCHLLDLDGLVELSVRSRLRYPTIDDVPRELLVACLRRSARAKVGFWCLADVDGEIALTVMWNVSRRQLDAQLFGDVVKALVVACDTFEADAVVDPDQLDRELHDLLGDDGGEGPR